MADYGRGVDGLTAQDLETEMSASSICHRTVRGRCRVGITLFAVL